MKTSDNNDKQKHTEGEWKLRTMTELKMVIGIQSDKGKLILKFDEGFGYKVREANAQRILKAVNNHDELVNSLKQLLHTLESQNNFEHHEVKSNAYTILEKLK